ncbi:MAG: sugar kinase [Deferrisomatales bacterium]
MRAPLDLVAVGRACVDEILEVDRFPPEDHKAPLLARVREGGGQAATAACLAAHLGGRAGFLGALGDDEPGRFARSRLEAFGVVLPARLPRRPKTPRAYCLVSRSRGTRTIVYERSPGEPLRWEELDLALLERARTVLVDPQGAHLLPRLAPWLRSRGVPVVADAERAEAGWEALWGRVDVLACSEGFLRGCASPGTEPADALLHLARRTSAACVATLGARGALALLGGRPVRIPAPSVPVRDTTGAGDAFHGALCLALARGRPLEAALPFAVAAASLSCRGLGGRSFPDAAEVAAVSRTLGLEPL